MTALVRTFLVIAALAASAAGCGSTPRRAAAPAKTPTPDASDVNREAKAPEIVHVYKTIGDDPYPWTLTVRTDHTANLIVGGGHGGGDDEVVRLSAADTARAERLTAAVPWRKVAGHTVEPGGFGGNDNMARYMLRRGRLSTVFAAGDMPRPMARLTRFLDHIIDGDIGTILESDRHFSSNGGILPTS